MRYILNIRRRSGGVLLPSGLILPLYSDSFSHADWNYYTGMENYPESILRSAGSGINVGALGTNEIANGYIPAGGDHTGNSDPFVQGFGEGFGGVQAGAINNGEHNHFTGTLTIIPDYFSVRFIKANKNTYDVPSNALVLTHTLNSPNNADAGVTYLNQLQKYMLTKSTTRLGGTSGNKSLVSSNGSDFTDTQGEHGHALYRFPYGSGAFVLPTYNPAGNHYHNMSLATLDLDFNTYYLRAWTKAAALFNVNKTSKVIGMWDTVTPPADWALCDGTLGTPDLRSCFIKLGSDGQVGTRANGTNQRTNFSISTNSVGHSHIGSTYTNMQYNFSYHADVVFHSHPNYVFNNSNYPYRQAIYFIMKL